MMRIQIGKLRRVIREVLEDDVERQIEELQDESEFKSVEAFAGMKLDNDEFEYNFVELQALARNIDQEATENPVATASQATIDKVRGELEGLGFEFVGRAPVKKIRGVTSSVHGTSPFVGMHGGSGAGGFGGEAGFGMGGVRSGRKWDASDPGNLSMGSRRR
jgi:hypothetical protein